MNILVTGGAGFIGSHLCERLLQRGHRVWIFDDLNAFYDPDVKRRNLEHIRNTAHAHAQPCAFHPGDLLDASDVSRLFKEAVFDQVIHLAARPGVRPSMDDPSLYFRVNAEGTALILQAAARQGVPKFILASSSSVYGAHARRPSAESDPVQSVISPYAASKLAAEALAHVYHHEHRMDVTVLRFFTAYGPRQRPDLAIHTFARLIHAGLPIPIYGDGSAARDYTYVDDLVHGIVNAAESALGFEIINLGQSRTLTVRQSIGCLEQVLGQSATLNHLPRQPGDVAVTCADISKAKRLLRYDPKTAFEEGIRRFAQWFLHNAPVSSARP